MAYFPNTMPKHSSLAPYYISNGLHSNTKITSTICSYSDTILETSQFRPFLNSTWDPAKEDPIEYFRRVITEILCDTSSTSYEIGAPRYFSSDFVQHVDGKILKYDDFVSHQKIQKEQIVENSVEVTWRELHAHFYDNFRDRAMKNVQEKEKILNITSHHTVRMKMKKTNADIIGSCVSLIKIDVKSGKIFQCNEFTHIGEQENMGSNNMKIINENWETYKKSD